MEQVIPQLVAHRGLMAHFPENSMQGVTAALNAGARYIEFDVQSIADGTLVLFHDPTLNRTTDRAGELFNLTRNDLASVDANEPGRLGDRFSSIRIPTLASVVELLRCYPDAGALVEVKPESLERFGLGVVIGSLLRVLHPILDRTTIISFHPPALEYLRKRAPEWMTGLVLRDYNRALWRTARRLAPDILIINREILKPGTSLWPGNWRWMVYDITDPELALEYARSGVQLIETGDIAGMLQHPLLGQGRLARCD